MDQQIPTAADDVIANLHNLTNGTFPGLAGNGTSAFGVAGKLRGGLRGGAARIVNKIATVYETHSWNAFRYIGDYLHLFGIAALFCTIWKNKSVKGISRSTQILYCCVFTCRYLDLVQHSQTAYLVVFKLTYIITSIIAVWLFHRLHSTYEGQKDTCSLAAIFVPCITASLLFANEWSPRDMLWSFSQFLEGFAMVPQYIFCYRDNQANDIGVTSFVFSLGGYRVFYAFNWIYKKIHLPQYNDFQSWAGGLIEISFFCDYLLSRITGRSALRAMVLTVDAKINEIQDKVEQKVLGASRMSKIGAHGGSELRRRGGKRADDSPPVDI